MKNQRTFNSQEVTHALLTLGDLFSDEKNNPSISSGAGVISLASKLNITNQPGVGFINKMVDQGFDAAKSRFNLNQSVLNSKAKFHLTTARLGSSNSSGMSYGAGDSTLVM